MIQVMTEPCVFAALPAAAQDPAPVHAAAAEEGRGQVHPAQEGDAAVCGDERHAAQDVRWLNPE